MPKNLILLIPFLCIMSCSVINQKRGYDNEISISTKNKKNENNLAINNKLVYSNLNDSFTQTEIKSAFLNAGIDENNINSFLEDVINFNKTVGNVGLTENGFKKIDSLKPRYNILEIHNKWIDKYSDFPGHNCRITTYNILNDFIDIEKLDVNYNPENLFIDQEAIEFNPKKLFSENQITEFMSLFSKIPTTLTKDVNVHLEKIKNNWIEKGVNFKFDDDKTKASFIFVFFHSSFGDDDNFLFIGHTGVLVPYKENKLLFVEKLSFDEPYQALIFDNRLELNDYLMSKYDVEWGQETANPIILENSKLLNNYRPNPLKSGNL